jgi:hypothetical protein
MNISQKTIEELLRELVEFRFKIKLKEPKRFQFCGLKYHLKLRERLEKSRKCPERIKS